MLIAPTESGLSCDAGGFHIDPWQPVARAVITHGHGDHLQPGSAAYLCADASLALVRHRLGADAAIEAIPYGSSIAIGETRGSFHPAGHILGSAPGRGGRRGGRRGEGGCARGEYRRAADRTCVPFEPQRCHAFITEATFALPVFR